MTGMTLAVVAWAATVMVLSIAIGTLLRRVQPPRPRRIVVTTSPPRPRSPFAAWDADRDLTDDR